MFIKKMNNSINQTKKLALLIFVCLFTTNANAQTYNWKLAYTWPDDFPMFTVGIKSMAEYARTLSNGRLNIEYVGATTHGEPLGVFDMVQSNDFQM